MYKIMWLLAAFLSVNLARAQAQKRAELSLVDAEQILLNNKQRCDSILTQKGYQFFVDDSSTCKNGFRTYSYGDKKGFLVKITAKADSLKIIRWDEPVSSVHLLLEEAKAPDYTASTMNTSILYNKYSMTILGSVPQVNRLLDTCAVLLAKKK